MTKPKIEKDGTVANKIEALARQRGFFYPTGEIYGGISGFYDYGHLGAAMKRKFENLWRRFFLGLDDNFVEIEPANVMPEKVFVASGHTQHFVDPVVKCKKCGTAHRADHIMEDFLKENFEGMTPAELEALIKKHAIRCPKCKGPLGDVRPLNMMFPVSIGVEGEGRAFLRAETAQGPYVDFKRQFEAMRKRLPLGLATIGRVYRNEISPRNILIRMREFSQAELQIFFDPAKIDTHPKFKEIERIKLNLLPVANRESGKILIMSAKDAAKTLKLPQFYLYYIAKTQQFYTDLLGVAAEKLRFKELGDEERAFYNKIHWDLELDLPSLGWKEVAGIHYRTDYDLSRHAQLSKVDLAVTVDGKKFIPHVLEVSFGIDRNVWAALELGYVEEKVGKEYRAVLRLPRLLAPFDAAIFPLVARDGLPEKAREIISTLGKLEFNLFYDEDDSIGRRYRRVDEIGVPFAITADSQTKKDDTVTIRDRDSLKQVRVPIKGLAMALYELQHGLKGLEKVGKA